MRQAWERAAHARASVRFGYGIQSTSIWMGDRPCHGGGNSSRSLHIQTQPVEDECCFPGAVREIESQAHAQAQIYI